jgi:acyl-CoA thioesterase-1|tara:strand:- start:2311 stop:2955 length:645 start_codon:yes stop_codon:yes gene_type:complete
LIILRYLNRRLRALAWVGLLIAGTLTPTVSQASLQSILVLGDSISAAYGMSLEEGWVALLQDRLQAEGVSYTVVNASISGDTSAGGLRRLPTLLTTHTPRIVIIELGGNDGLRGYPISQLTQNLERMIQLSESVGAIAVILPMEIPPNLGKVYTDAFRNSFAKAAENTDALLGDFPLESVALNPTLMQADGIHPTAEAQSLIMESVWQVLEPVL